MLKKILDYLTTNITFRIILMLGIGIFLIIFFPTQNFEFDIFMHTIGVSIISGGFFAILLKLIQFSGVFREEIREVIFQEENLKSIKKDLLQKYWDNVTKFNFFDIIEMKENKNFLEEAKKKMTFDCDLVYHDVKLKYKIEVLENSLIKITEDLSYFVKINSPESNIPVKFRATNKLHVSEQIKDDIKILDYKINNIDFINNVINTNITDGDFVKNTVSVDASFDFNAISKNKNKVECKRKMHCILSSKTFEYWKVSFVKIISNLDIHVEYDEKKLLVNFETFGSTFELKDVFNEQIFPKSKKGVILPRCSFLLLITRI